MTPRDSEGPRPDSPGPTPRLDAVERLRRQLEATTARAAKRAPRAPRSPSPDQSHDLFGRDSTDPYASGTGTWNYGPDRAVAYSPAPEADSSDYQRSSWRTTDNATTSDDQSVSPQRDIADNSRPDFPEPPTPRTAHGRDLQRPAHPADDTLDLAPADVEPAPNPSRPHRRPPTGRRRAPGQWREEAPTAPGDGGAVGDTGTGRSLRAPESPDIVPISPTASREEKLQAARAALAEATAAAKAAEGAQDSKTRSRRTTRDSVATKRESAEFGDAEGAAPGANRRGRPIDHTTDLRHGSGDSDSADREPIARRSSRRDDVNSPMAGDYSYGGGFDNDTTETSRRGTRRRGGYLREEDPEHADAAGDSGERRGRRGRRRGRGDSGEESPQPGAPVGGGTEAQAKEVCLRMLADRARSRAEMADRLAEKGFAAAVAKRALDRLAEVGLVDDAAFAQQWVYSRHTYSGKGKKVLAEELRRKGIAPGDAEPALETITPEAEAARAAELARRKLATLSPDLDRDKVISRLAGLLARRGYTPGTAYAVATAELAAAAERRQHPDHDSDLSPRLPVRSPRAATRRDSTTDGPLVDGSPEADLPPSSTRSPSKRDVKRREFASDDTDSAADLVRAKLRTLSPNLDRETATRRLVGMLARRGFTAGTAYRVVSAELEAAAALQPAESGDHPEPTSEFPRSSLARRAGRASDRDTDQVAHTDRPEHLDAGVNVEDDPATSEDDEFARAADLVRAKLRTLPPNLDRAKATNRLVGLLARRGFSQSTAYSVVKSELANNY
ncbi:hypothetical protein GCM10027167_68430 [Nocardia heshunensis]